MTLTLHNGWTKGQSQILQLNLYDYGTPEPGLQTNSEQSNDIQKITRQIYSKRTRFPYIPERSQYSQPLRDASFYIKFVLYNLSHKFFFLHQAISKKRFHLQFFFFFNLNFFCVRKIRIAESTPFKIRAITVNDFNGIDLYQNKYEFIILLSLKNELNRESS